MIVCSFQSRFVLIIILSFTIVFVFIESNTRYALINENHIIIDAIHTISSILGVSRHLLHITTRIQNPKTQTNPTRQIIPYNFAAVIIMSPFEFVLGCFFDACIPSLMINAIIPSISALLIILDRSIYLIIKEIKVLLIYISPNCNYFYPSILLIISLISVMIC